MTEEDPEIVDYGLVLRVAEQQHAELVDVIKTLRAENRKLAEQRDGLLDVRDALLDACLDARLWLPINGAARRSRAKLDEAIAKGGTEMNESDILMIQVLALLCAAFAIAGIIMLHKRVLQLEESLRAREEQK